MNTQSIITMCRKNNIKTEVFVPESAPSQKWLHICCKYIWAIPLKGDVEGHVYMSKKGVSEKHTLASLIVEIKKGKPMMRVATKKEQKKAKKVDLGPATIFEFLASCNK
jgi:hypothetical protein